MRDALPDGWQRLTCSCGTERYAKTVHLRYRRGGGITEEPAGYFCLECHGLVDSAALIAKAELQAKHRELRELEEELGSQPAPKAMAAPAGKGK